MTFTSALTSTLHCLSLLFVCHDDCSWDTCAKVSAYLKKNGIVPFVRISALPHHCSRMCPCETDARLQCNQVENMICAVNGEDINKLCEGSSVADPNACDLDHGLPRANQPSNCPCPASWTMLIAQQSCLVLL